MAKVLFKKGPSQSFDTDKDLNSIIFKKSTNPQAPGFSEIYLGDNRCGVGHNFSIGSDGLVPAPTMADIGKVLTPNGWIDLSKISGSDNVKQVGIESSTTLYPILLKGTTGVSDYTGQVNFTSTVNQNTPLLSASPNGHLHCKSLGVIEGDSSFLLGDINLMDMPVMSGGHSLNLVSSVNSSTESSPSILLARSTSLETTTDQYTNWRIQNAANGVLTFTPEKTGTSETPFVSVLSNVTATSFTVSGASSADTYIKANGSGYGGVFTGAGEAAGAAGLVPAPAIGDAGKYLKGDGTWGEIQGGTQSDWEEDDSTEPSYVQNRPAVRAGTGTNAVVEGDIENVKAWGLYSHAEGGDSVWTSIELSGDADSSSYTVDQSSANIVLGMVLHYNGSYASVIDTYTFDDEVTVVLDNTLDENNALSNAEVDIVGGVSMGSYSHSEGFHTVSGAMGSHSEGYGTIAVNDGEHAEGKYNLPTSSNMVGSSITQHNTVHTIGIGLNEGTRMNAVEVKYNGDMYLYGVGGYEGNNYNEAQTLQGVIADIQDFGSNMVSTTHPELENLIANSQLIPGQQYRITDYVCTTTQANTQSAGHQFDIIVTADSENTLNENARAIQHTTSNQDYFYNCDLDSWELKYSFSGDTDRFAWADPDPASYTMGITLTGVVIGGGQNTTTATFVSDLGTGYWKWKRADNNNFLYSVANPEVGGSVYSSAPSPGMIALSQGTINSITPTGNRGVIYYMKDEWNNIAPFDFKNILFTRDSEWFGDHQQWAEDVLGEVPSTNMNFYFLSWVTQNNEVQDASVVGQTLANDEGSYNGVFNNEIKGTSAYDMSIVEDETSILFALPCTIIVSSYNYEEGVFYGCQGNTFGSSCYWNTFGNYCKNNSFGNGCQGNTFGNGFQNNTFGNNCYSNTIGNFCYNNSFGNECYQNSFGNDCFQNSFGNDCNNNTFGNYCTLNSFGNFCYNNSFGNFCYSNSFGNYCTFNSFGNYCQSITVFDNVQYCNITGGTSSVPVKNAQILNGTRGSSPYNKLTITFAANKNYTQVAGLVNGTDLRIWIAEDTVTGPSSAGSNRIAVFNGTTGKIIKDSGVYISNLLTIDDLVTPVTYGDLVDLITGESLVPGMQYRITDYTCTTTQENTTSANHSFDIIVTADSENTLNENARAAHHDGDDYFSDCDLGAWELKYSIYNDKNKFSWADCNYVAVSEIQTIKPEADELFAIPEAANILQHYWQETISTYISGAQTAFFASDSGPGETIFKFSNDGGSSLSNDLFIIVPTNSLVYSNSLLTIKCGNSEYKIHLGEIDGETVSETSNGLGVIYYMKDEWGNECPYDFKNIMFKRWAISEVTDSKLPQDALEDLNYGAFVFESDNTYFQTRFGYQGTNCTYGSTVHVVDSDTGWYYTFSVIMKDVDRGEYFLNDIEDGSIKGNNYYNDGDAGGFYGNTIMPRYDNMASDIDGIDGAQVLNNIVLNGYYEYLGSGNEIDTNPYIYGCNNNSFGYNCCDSTFGNNCGNNSFGSNCYGNSFSGGFIFNSFGNSCQRNSFGNDCQSNAFGNYCYSNSFGKGCGVNTFGNSCQGITFGNNCNYNSFVNGCINNSFGNNCNYNSFGNNYKGNSFGNYCQYITVFDNVQFCSVTGGSQSFPVKNAQILNGTKGTSLQNKLTITFAANQNYTQVVGLVNGTDLRIWIAEDTVTGPSSVVNNRIALFDGTTGKIIKDSGVTVEDLQVDVPEYTIEKLGTAETGYISSYVLKKDGVQAGSTINIPKDYLVKSGSVVEVVLYNGHYYESTDTGHTTQLDGYGVNSEGKYLKFVVNTVDDTGNTSSIYISVQDLVDAYNAGNGIAIDASNYISVKIDSANANGLATTTAGLKLDTVTTTTNGAMTATDKVKLDSINGNYWGSQTLSAAASYITTPEFQQVTINGDPTATQASTDHCVMVYDTTNKCLKFTF